MKLYVLTEHDDGSSKSDSIKLFTNASAAISAFKSLVKQYRMLGRPEVEEERVTVSRDPDGSVYGKAVFTNSDETWSTVKVFDKETEK